MVAMAEGSDRNRHQSTSRRLKAVSVEAILDSVASYYDVDAESYAMFRSQAPGRDMAAWLCRKWTGATLRQLGPFFGLSGVDSVSNLVRRAEKRYAESRKWKRIMQEIESSLGLNTEHKA